MLIISILVIICVAIALWSAHSRRAKLRNSLHFIGEGAPRLRISVVIAGVRSVNYIAESLKSESSAYQVVIVADFQRHEQLLRSITHYFGLFKTQYSPSDELAQGAVRALFRSHRRLFSKVVVVDSPRSSRYTPFEVGAVVSSYNYNLQVDSKRALRPRAIENLLLELALRPEGSVEQITSMIGERFKLLCREAALPSGVEKIEVKRNRRVKIGYRVLK